MNKILLPLLVLLAGLGVGGGAALAVGKMVDTALPPAGTAAAADVAQTRFVPVSKILAPLVTADGRLSGYVSFDVELEVPVEQADHITARLPMLRHAINLRTYRTPMAAGPDGMLPDLTAFRVVVNSAATEAFGDAVVKRIAITQAVPS